MKEIKCNTYEEWYAAEEMLEAKGFHYYNTGTETIRWYVKGTGRGTRYALIVIPLRLVF